MRSLGKLEVSRRGTQVVFAMLCLWIGVEFHLFVRFLDSGGEAAFVERPPGAEGFLPISSLMSLYYFFISGNLHPYHPAGLVIFCVVLLISWLFGKSFCSWICPVGLLSELLVLWRKRLYKRDFKIPSWLDGVLRSLKYVLLGFFVFAIVKMPFPALRAFLDGPYNLMADVKMYTFFAEISLTAITVLMVLALASALLPRFWCRYFCPYGALLGLASLLSPHKIKRHAESCTACGTCNRACPSSILVADNNYVVSDECLSCMQCVHACPQKNTLQMQNVVTREAMPPKTVGLWIVGIFLFLLSLAQLLGFWHNKVPINAYLQLYQQVDELDHPKGL